MRTVAPPAFKVGDRVRTDKGEGTVKFVFPGGARGKTTYAVRFWNKRVGTVFSEEQVTLVKKRHPGWRDYRSR